jgi:small neutral amino acid transporter SnatA (MarC family)
MKFITLIIALILTIFVVFVSFLVSKEVEKIIENYGNKTWPSWIANITKK